MSEQQVESVEVQQAEPELDEPQPQPEVHPQLEPQPQLEPHPQPEPQEFHHQPQRRAPQPLSQTV